MWLKFTVFVLFIAWSEAMGNTGNFEENSITYDYDTSSKITWYENYKNCKMASKYIL